MPTVKLSAVQQDVMRWLSGGWTAHVAHGCAVHINGERVCNTDTMAALIRKGLVERIDRWTFAATKLGKLGEWD